MTAPMRLTRANVENLRRSARLYGFGSLPRSISPALLGGLQSEARRRAGETSRAEQNDGVRYRASISALGRRAYRFLRSGEVSRLLSAAFGRRYALSEQRSCVTHYGEGDYLGPHLDEPAADCAVTVIVYLNSKGRPGRARTGLQLRVYGRTLARSRRPRLILPTRSGAVIIGRGSQFWHERPMLAKGESLVALTACYWAC